MIVMHWRDCGDVFFSTSYVFGRFFSISLISSNVLVVVSAVSVPYDGFRTSVFCRIRVKSAKLVNWPFVRLFSM